MPKFNVRQLALDLAAADGVTGHGARVHGAKLIRKAFRREGWLNIPDVALIQQWIAGPGESLPPKNPSEGACVVLRRLEAQLKKD